MGSSRSAPRGPGASEAWKRGTPVEANVYNHNGAPLVRRASVPLQPESPLIVDLFCGCGGFSEGFRQAGFQTLLALDIHPPSLATFASNHPEATVVLGDIRRVPDELFLETAEGRPVAVVTAGVPCQGFSLNNRKRHDADERNFLFREFIRLVRLLQPAAVVLENVSSLRAAANGGFARAISSAIDDAGYRVTCRVLNAAEFGVPQLRRRIFFIGVRENLGFSWPRPSHGSPSRPFVTVWEAIGDLPAIEAGQSATAYTQEPWSEYQRAMRGGWKHLANHQAPSHPEEVIRKIAATSPGEPMYPRFRQRIRLHPGYPSPTQVSGGIRPQFQFGHPSCPRGLTVRERCRMQSFGDSYVIEGGIVQGRVQTGNAVPPLLARAIAEALRDALKGIVSPVESLPDGHTQLALLA